ncbi:MAG TPA: heme-dependent oxidative N-demethylase subunit alpha family protein [Oscillatoriaceae cyanobacterium]
MLDTIQLPAPPDYFPPSHGRYDVSAGLKPLGAQSPFQIDVNYLDYLEAKAASRRENPAKYFLTHDFSDDLHRAVTRYACESLAAHYPDYFGVEGDRFVNHLIGLSARLDFDALRVAQVRHGRALLPGGDRLYREFDLEGAALFDFLALQTQEDWAVDAIEPETRREWLAALHLSFPNHWSPAEKIGRAFVEVHRPVAAIEPLLKAAPSLIETMIFRGPWERFAWDIRTDRVLNRHPDDLDASAGRLEDYSAASVGAGTYMRIERQALKGFPGQAGALFLIRTYFRPVAEVATNPDEREALAKALRTMKPESLVYKGLTRLQEPLVAYLSGEPT